MDRIADAKVTRSALPKDVGLTTVDGAITSAIRSLKFPQRLEDAFEAETGRQRCAKLIVGSLVGIVLYDFFLLVDWLATPDVFVTALWVRLGFVTPFELALTSVFLISPPAFWREMSIVGGAIVAAIAHLYLMLLSHSPYRDSQHQAFILIVLFVAMAQRARFRYSIATCLVYFALYAATLVVLADYPAARQIPADIVFGGVVAFTLVASYSLERETRLNYLLSLRARIQNHELDIISRRDPLTGVGNRRSLDEALAKWEQNRTSEETLSVVLVDIDHFKLFNDAAGHPAGDFCLKRVAGALQGQLRNGADRAYRFDGEEFLVMLHATDLSTAVGVAERMRRAIEEAAIPHPAFANGSIVTASFGVASAKPGEDMRAAEIIASADAGLYAAKRNGRNQVWPRFLAARRSEIVDMTDRKSQSG